MARSRTATVRPDETRTWVKDAPTTPRPQPVGIPYVDPSPEFTNWWKGFLVDLYTPAYDAARAAFAAGLALGEQRRAARGE